MVLRIGDKASFLMADQAAKPSSGDWLLALLILSGQAGFIVIGEFAGRASFWLQR